MAVLKVRFDNILCFNDFEADFSYPKKIVKTTLDSEYLLDYPNIRYKKVNIIIGTNASGKTSLGKAIWKTFIFMINKESKPFKDLVSDKNKEATILMDCVFKEGVFFRFEAVIKPDGDINARYRKIDLLKTDTYESVVKRLKEDEPFDNYLKVLEEAVIGGWNFCFPTIETGFDFIFCKQDSEEHNQRFVNTLKKVLQTFDPAIETVFKSLEQDNTYIIRFFNGQTVAVKHGEKLSGLSYLSSGTKSAINVAGLMCAIENHDNGFYYVDEQFSFVNSDIEIACLNTMIDLLGDGEQLFFTSHNEELMSLPLPIHSFSFMKKSKNDNDEYHVEMINASSFEKRNNVSVKNLYDNDYFDIAPDTTSVFSIRNN